MGFGVSVGVEEETEVTQHGAVHERESSRSLSTRVHERVIRGFGVSV